MTTSFSGRVALAALLALGAACSRGEAPAPPLPPATSPSSAPVAPAEEVRQVVLRSLTLGKSINSDGSVAAAADTFAAGDPLFVSLDVQPISPGTEVRLSWRGPGLEDNGEEEMVVPAGARIVNFKARDTSGWTPGTHRMEIALGGAVVGAKEFRIAGAASPAAAPASPR